MQDVSKRHEIVYNCLWGEKNCNATDWWLSICSHLYEECRDLMKSYDLRTISARAQRRKGRATSAPTVTPRPPISDFCGFGGTWLQRKSLTGPLRVESWNRSIPRETLPHLIVLASLEVTVLREVCMTERRRIIIYLYVLERDNWEVFSWWTPNKDRWCLGGPPREYPCKPACNLTSGSRSSWSPGIWDDTPSECYSNLVTTTAFVFALEHFLCNSEITAALL